MSLRCRISPPKAALGTATLLDGAHASSGAAPDHAMVVLEGDSILIGRGAGADLSLPFSTVSSAHARLVRTGSVWMVEDQGSANGTWMGGRRLPPRLPAALPEDGCFAVADVVITVEPEPGSVPRATTLDESEDGGGSQNRSDLTADATLIDARENTASLARRLVADLFGASRPAEQPQLQVEAGVAADIGRILPLAHIGRTTRVGRGAGCDLALTDNQLSREHAAFERRAEGAFVLDLGSKNGVWIDGVRVEHERKLADGDLLVMGSSQLRFRDPVEQYLRQVEAASQAKPMVMKAPDALPSGPEPGVSPVLGGVTSPAATPRPGRAGRSVVMLVGLAVAVLAVVALVGVVLVLGLVHD